MEPSTSASKTIADLNELLKTYDAVTDTPTNGFIINRFLVNIKKYSNTLLNTLLFELSNLTNPVPWNKTSLQLKILHLHEIYMKLSHDRARKWDELVTFLATNLKPRTPKPKKIKINNGDEDQEILGPRSESLCKHCHEKGKAMKNLSLEMEKLKIKINELRRQYNVQVMNQKLKHMSECLTKQKLKNSKLKLENWKLKRPLAGDNANSVVPIQAATINNVKLLKKKLHSKKASLKRCKNEIEKLKTVISELNCQIDDLNLKIRGF